MSSLAAMLAAIDSQPAGATGTIFARDTFTDTAGTTLQAHTPEVGGPWVKHGSATVDAGITDANRARTFDAANYSTEDSIYYLSGTPATADYDVEMDVVKLGGGGASDLKLLSRLSTSAFTCYYASFDSGGGMFLGKMIAGAFTTLAGSSPTVTITFDGKVELICRTASQQIYYTPVSTGVRSLLLSATDTSITAAGKAGMQLRNINTNTVGVHVDNFKAKNA